jgi:hypothetical protein
MKKKKIVSKRENGGLEVTTFKLASGFSFVDFVKANEDVDEWSRGMSCPSDIH